MPQGKNQNKTRLEAIRITRERRSTVRINQVVNPQLCTPGPGIPDSEFPET